MTKRLGDLAPGDRWLHTDPWSGQPAVYEVQANEPNDAAPPDYLDVSVMDPFGNARGFPERFGGLADWPVEVVGSAGR